MSYPQPSQVTEERPGARESSRWAPLAPAASPRPGLSADALRYHFLAERLNEVVFHLDRQGHFTFLSPAWTSLTGVSVESELGQSLMQRVHPEEQSDVRRLLESIAARVQASFRLEVRLLTSRGTQWVELAAFSSPTGQGELLGTLTDITERRQLQARLQQADRLATLGMLVPGFAHEMNNPLAFMAANLDYLLTSMAQAGAAGAPASEVAAWREAVEEIIEGSERLRRTLGHLRGFRPEPGQGPVDVNLLLDTVGQLVSSVLRSRGRLVRDHGARSLVPGGGGSLRQALLNLVLHAVLSLPDDGEDPEAHEVRLVTRDDGQGHVVIEIHDTGPGLAPELLPHVFEPLFPSKGGNSSGPALCVSRDIVRELGGDIEVTSSRGRGTTFRVTLPGVS
ncbi:PAS domain-containing sensor histidine kinase [Cystobacter fuscus]|uniref:histidine kinase n=1 Tax=Cystobacter fuscus TaxID=43 RepID=A0A250IUM4_9BACT|nr:ATP-binding protein [Cystobacter fuscus]ATB35455.1 PAS domain-containing sensor histidine kinase [Cystobacter fuscus]